MSNKAEAPTMIIPAGTEISIDVHGQLSVRTPGNLVIQNSGHYGEIESTDGSIRIEANAEVEAASVRCAGICYIQGSLTSWKVKAQGIQLEEKAQARIVLQETESLEIGIELQLPDGGKPVTQGADHGLPLAASAPKNPLRKEIAKLATSLHELGKAEAEAA